MIQNFFHVALRSFMRQRLYSLINVLGLASGLMCTLFIYLWVNDELSKDKFHQESEKIFLILANLKLNEGETLTWTHTPGPLAEHLRQTIPEVEMAVRTARTGALLFQHGEKSFMENGYYADPDFFKLFNFKIIQGKANSDSSDIVSISISQKLAAKLFGNADPLGKNIRVNNKTDYTVGAVFQDIGTESSIQFEYILPFEVIKKQRGDGFSWGNFDDPTYVKLRDQDQAEAIAAKVNTSTKKMNEGGVVFYLQRFTETYLYGQYKDGRPVGGRIKYVRIFTVVAIFILVIACINFMNMATAKAATRAKEVGVRKVVGAQRRSLVVQFITESTFISFISALFALTLVGVLLGPFNALVNKHIAVDFLSVRFLANILIIVLVTGLLAGSYPAFFLSSYQPSKVLKGSAFLRSGSALRKGLVIFQFALTVILIACSLVIYSQIEFIRNTDVGYNRQSVLTFSIRGDLSGNFEAFKNEALQFSGITHVAKASNSLVYVNNQNGSVQWPGKSEKSTVLFRTVVVDYDFMETMGLKLKEGRIFSRDHNDTSTFVISARAAEVMGMKDPVGTRIVQWGLPGKIIGVVNDFHSQSLHEAIDPIVFVLKPNWDTNIVFVRFEAGQLKQSVDHLSTLHKKFNPQYPFVYSFLDDDFEKMYNNEKVTGSLALGFTLMAIIISGLGLLGLAAYTAERNRKEISIRKTLGASVTKIITTMSTEFVKLSLIASFIGCPIAYYLMDKFLEGYAYHAGLEWSLFLITAVCTLGISLLTVIFQVTRAAIANPVDALRNE